MQNFNKKIVKGFAWEGGTKFVIQILSWTSTIIVARLLTPEDYGIVAVSGVFVLLMSIFSDMGITAGLINQKEISKNQITGIFWCGLFLSCFLYSLVLIFSPFVEQLFQMPGLSSLMNVSALVLLFSSVRFIPSAMIMREMNFKFRAVVDMFGQFIMILVTLVLAYLNYGPWSLILGTVVMHFFITLAYMPHMQRINGVSLHWNETKSIINYGSKLMFSRMLAYLTRSMPTFFIGLMLGQKSAGHYSLAEQIGKIPLDKIGMTFNRIIFPSISRIQEDVEHSRSLFLKMHKTLMMVSVPVLVGFSFVSHDLVMILFTEKWAASIPILQLTALLNIFLVSMMIMPPVIEGMGKPEIVIRHNIILLCLLTIATLIGLQWGLVGMVACWFLVYPITYTYMLIKLTSLLELRLKSFFKSIKSIFIATFVMASTLFLLTEIMMSWETLIRLAVLVVAGFLTYVGVYYTFFKSDLVNIANSIRANLKT